MSAVDLIVCEKSGRWAAAIAAAPAARRAASPRLAEVRSLTQLQRELEASPQSIAAVDVTAENLEVVLGWLVQASSRYADVRLVALLAPEVAPAEALFREAGAVEVLTSVVEAPCLARMAGQQSRRFPRPLGSFRELLAQRMPFAAHA